MPNNKPNFIQGEIIRNAYDGIRNDLLTGGLGMIGLQGPTPQVKQGTPEELRTLAIYSIYKGLMDLTTSGGFGRFLGPNVDTAGLPTEGDGKIAGKEYLAYMDDGSGRQNVTLMVQVPDTFDPANACIIAAPSSGSRGIYGAVPVVGEWALKRGFAVAYTDKGTGVGLHDLDSNTVTTITGNRIDADTAGIKSSFTANINRHEFIREYPHRVAFKHAHSEQHPQSQWGNHVLCAIKFAFYILNLEENFGKRNPDGTIETVLTPKNTFVIASGVSNGGCASIHAAEQDDEGLIHGVAVSEPNITPAPDASIIIRQGDREWRYPNHSRNMFDYITLMAIYQPGACFDPRIRDLAPMNLVAPQLNINRCLSLAEKGLIHSATPEDMAMECQKIINDHGILPEQNLIAPSHHGIYIYEGIAVTYSNSFGRFRVSDNLCGFSFAAIDPETRAPAPLPEIQAMMMFSTGNGIAPSGGVEIINNLSEGGPRIHRESVSRSGVQDQNLDGMLCLRRLATGSDEFGNPLTGEPLEHHHRIRKGVESTLGTGRLNGRPVLIVHGRNDAILPPNHTSRPYAALADKVQDISNLRYYEVTNAHHLDMLNSFPGFNSRYVPLHYYFLKILDRMIEHLKTNKPLPPSQVIHTIPRGISQDGSVPDLIETNLPPILDAPDDMERIRIEHGTIAIPD